MQRDGTKISLWQESVAYIPYPVPSPSDQYDVVIVGGGMTGVLTAFNLQKAGKKCLLIEAYNLGYGATGGTTAHLNTLLDTPYTTIDRNFGPETSRLVASAASAAIDQIKKHIDDLEIACEFTYTPAYIFSGNDEESERLASLYESGKRAGLELAFSTTLPISVSFEKALRIEHQAQFHPLKYLFALAHEYEEMGGHILTQCKMEGRGEIGSDIQIITSCGNIKAKKVVYATHIPSGINLPHLECAPKRSYVLAVELENDDYPEGLVYDMKDPYYYYRTHVMDGIPYLIVGGRDHKTGARTNTAESLLALRIHIENNFKVKKIAHSWSSQYFESADGLPYIGALPGHNEAFYIATGYGGNGMIYSHVAASEISGHILTGKSTYENLFSPSRTKPIVAFNNFVDHPDDVVKHFVGKYFEVEQLEELADLSPGQGQLVLVDGLLIALSRDLQGELHAVSSICTHTKCNVVWNGAEQSWDCPLDGSRYSLDGKVLNGPAIHDLEFIEVGDLVGVKK